jgi:O-acetylhomoserine/O-acetylserine sulfhydrylase-like pyridoxal-dependent enzyme
MIIEVEFKYKKIDRRFYLLVEQKIKRFGVVNITQINHNMKDKTFILNIILKYECNAEELVTILNEIPNVEVINYQIIEDNKQTPNKRRRIFSVKTLQEL